MLGGMRILLVEDDEDSREMLGIALSARGADVQLSASGEQAIEIARSWPPDIALLDLSLPTMTGGETLAKLRTLAGLGTCPTIAISGHGRESDRASSLAAGFAKHLVKPAALSDILSAVATACRPTDPIRSVLETVNRASSCQYTSMLRFAEDGTIVSVWTFDREQPALDPFPVGLTVDASYCILVRETGSTCVIEDARTDDRVTLHPKRETLAAYLGVPIRRTDGAIFGTLCSFDANPQQFAADLREEHEAAARALAMMLP
jgi:CheY-like chemotaxis protein